MKWRWSERTNVFLCEEAMPVVRDLLMRDSDRPLYLVRAVIELYLMSCQLGRYKRDQAYAIEIGLISPSIMSTRARHVGPPSPCFCRPCLHPLRSPQASRRPKVPPRNHTRSKEGPLAHRYVSLFLRRAISTSSRQVTTTDFSATHCGTTSPWSKNMAVLSKSTPCSG